MSAALRAAHEAASRRVDASARIIAAELLAARLEGRDADLEIHLRIHQDNVDAEASARSAWMDARSATAAHNDSQNGR